MTFEEKCRAKYSSFDYEDLRCEYNDVKEELEYDEGYNYQALKIKEKVLSDLMKKIKKEYSVFDIWKKESINEAYQITSDDGYDSDEYFDIKQTSQEATTL